MGCANSKDTDASAVKLKMEQDEMDVSKHEMDVSKHYESSVDDRGRIVLRLRLTPDLASAHSPPHATRTPHHTCPTPQVRR